MHKVVQWEALARHVPPPSTSGRKTQDCLPKVQDPIVGELDIGSLQALLRLLAAWSNPGADNCYFGLSVIEGWLNQFDGSDLEPLLTLPDERTYIVIKGPISASFWKGIKSPNLIWAIDRCWYAVSDIDFDSTLFGGHQELINAIIDDPRLEAWQVEPDDSLASDADMFN
jgi:hypothetical protein